LNGTLSPTKFAAICCSSAAGSDLSGSLRCSDEKPGAGQTIL
jgi:hypothetical protein